MIDRRTMLSATAIAAAAPLSAVPVKAAVSEGELPQGLDGLARRRCLRFGTAVSARYLGESAYQALLVRDCSVITPENDLKWKWLEPRQGVYDLAKAKRINSFADTHGMAIRGHTFAWNDDDRVPPWLVAMEAELRPSGGRKLVDLMRRHARFLAETFPHVNSWDCVNEALHVQDGTLADSVFSRVLGERFFDIAFGLMREYAPWARAVYNGNMSWEQNPRHRAGVLRLLEGALKRGVRIDALGIQSHLGNTLGHGRNERDWRFFLEEIRGMGLEAVITELDCSDRHLETSDPQKRDAEVAAYVKGYLDLTLSFSNVRGVVTWALTDRHSNMNRPNYPEEKRRADGLPIRGTPYDDNLEAKPMYRAIAAALKAAPQR